MYKISELSELAGVSTRTLRYYDEIELLVPSHVSEAGYRLYDEEAVDKLQHILFYKTLGFSLSDIKKSLQRDDFDEMQTLECHYERLLKQQSELAQVIATLEKTIEAKGGGEKMSDVAKFEGLKQQMLDENEVQYGEEIRSSYDEDFYAKSQQKFKNMSKWQFERSRELEQEIIELLKVLVPQGVVDERLELVKKHHEWLMFYWPSYSKEAHVGLGEMYVSDERFKQYYDKHIEGAAQYLKEAIIAYTQQ